MKNNKKTPPNPSNFITFDQFKSELADLTSSIAAKLNIVCDELNAWVEEEGQKLFEQTVRASYNSFIQDHGYRQMTQAYVESLITNGFDAMYTELTKKVLGKSYQARLNDINTIPYSMREHYQKEINKSSILPDYQNFQAKLANKNILMGIYTQLFQSLHAYLKKNPEVVADDELMHRITTEQLQATAQVLKEVQYLANKKKGETANPHLITQTSSNLYARNDNVDQDPVSQSKGLSLG